MVAQKRRPRRRRVSSGFDGFPEPALPRTDVSDHASFVSVLKTSSRNTLWTTFGVLAVVVGLIIAYRYYKNQSTEEHYVGNVGSQGTYTDIQTSGSKKLLQCYQDNDCPDETRCSEKGICIPIIHPIPKDFHMMKLGRGRENEKPSSN